MKRQLVRLLLFSLPFFLLASCGKDEMGNKDPNVPGAHGDIAFDIGFAPQMRVSTGADFTSAWETGDEIGVFAVAHGQTLSATASDNLFHNAKLTWNGTSWTQQTPLYFPAGSDALDFYAYYPYDAAATDPTNITFNVKSDQGGTTTAGDAQRSNYNLSDLLTAKSDNSGNGWAKGSIVSLTFSHALAMVQVSVPSPGKGFGPGENLTVTLRGVKARAVLDLSAADGTTPGSGVTLAGAGNDAAGITMYRVEQPADDNYGTSYTYRALVPAQSVAAGNSLFQFSHEQRMLLSDGALAQALQMVAGQAEKFERTLPVILVHTKPVPAGTFLMGSSDGSNPDDADGTGLNTTPKEPNRSTNETQHRVTLTRNFRMSTYQVTNAQYAAFLNAEGIGQNGTWATGNYPAEQLIYASSDEYDWGLHWETDKWVPVKGYENHPMINVTWYGADEYARWAGGFLPTEAQWEYACRGGKENLPFGIGTGYELNNTLAHFNWEYSWSWNGVDPTATIAATGSGYPETPQAVGTYPYSSGFGLYDMHGNVWEWCSDWYGAYDSDLPTDPTGPATGSQRVLRGGHWFYDAQYCRSASRDSATPGDYFDYVGFRVAFGS